MALRNMRKRAKAVGHIAKILKRYGKTNRYRIRIVDNIPGPQDEVYLSSSGKPIVRKKKMTEEVHAHKGLPVAGYKPTQSKANVDLVNEGKQIEERVMRYIEKVEAFNIARNGGDPCMSSIGRTQIQLGFMAVFRAVFDPQRITLPEDSM